MAVNLPLFLSLIIWGIGELYVYLKLTNKDGEIKDGGSSRLLEIGTILMLGLTIYLQFDNRFGHMYFKNWFPYLGLFITIGGVLFRQYSIYVLGAFFSGYVRVTKKHKLIQHGPYKFFRHPSYFGSVISYLGMGIASSNIVCIFLLPIGISGLYIYRTKVEEELLSKEFGEYYKNYKEKTWGFLPFVK